MVDGGDCGPLAPGQSQEGADGHHHGHHQQVQVVTAPLLQLVLLPVDDDLRDLVVHEDEDGAEDGHGEGERRGPRGVAVSASIAPHAEEGDDPRPTGHRRLDLRGDLQLGGGDADKVVCERGGQEGERHGEVGDSLAHRVEHRRVLEFLESDGDEEGGEEEEEAHQEHVGLVGARQGAHAHRIVVDFAFGRSWRQLYKNRSSRKTYS